MSRQIGMIADSEVRTHVKKAVEQGFIIGRQTKRGLSILGKDDDPEKRGRIVTVVPTTKGQNGTVGNVVAELRRAGYDPDWVAPKRSTSAYDQKRIDAMARALEIEDEQVALEREIEPWKQGPMLQRAVTFLAVHPDRRFTLRYLASRCEVDEHTFLHNGTNISRRDNHIVYFNKTLMYDSLLIPDEMYLWERAAAEMRARNETGFPIFFNGEEWSFDEFGRLVMPDIDGKEWLAVPRHVNS